MNQSWQKGASLPHLLVGCWLVFLLAACGTTATTRSGTASPTPTAQPPTPTPVMKLVLTFVCPQAFGATADNHERVCVRTLAGAALTIHVTFCRGNVDQSDSLQGAFTADQTGYYEWNWTPKATCENPPGHSGFWQGTAEVTATLDEQTVTNGIDFLA